MNARFFVFPLYLTVAAVVFIIDVWQVGFGMAFGNFAENVREFNEWAREAA